MFHKIEYQRGNKGLQIDGNMKQTVYVFKCEDSTITVNGKVYYHSSFFALTDNKVNSIILDSCKKCALVFNDSVAGLEIINSQRIQSQVTGKCPIINGKAQVMSAKLQFFQSIRLMASKCT